MSNGKWVVIEEGKLRLLDAAPQLEQLAAMQRAVGGYIELFLQVASVERPGGTVDFYCNDEGRLNGMAPNVLVDAGDGFLFDIAGPVLITAGNRDGETVPLTEDELSRLRVVAREGTWPMVTYNV